MSSQQYSTIHTSGDIGDFDIVPLTTVWAPASGCPSIVTFAGDNEDPSCYPPDYTSVWYSYGFYSPGICPSGYTSGCKPEATDSYFGGTVRSSETAAICVPSSYSCSSFLLHAVSVSGSKTVSVPAFQIRWAAADLSALETPPIQSASGAASASRSTVVVSGASSTDSGSSASSSGSSDSAGSASSSGSSKSSNLSTGAVVGIAVGSAAVVAIIAGVLFFLFRKRVLSARENKNSTPPPDQASGGRAELDAPVHTVNTTAIPKESHLSSTIPEMESHGNGLPPPEYSGDSFVYTPPNVHDGRIPQELPPSDGRILQELPLSGGRIQELGAHGEQGIGMRYELGTQERPLPEMHGSYPRR